MQENKLLYIVGDKIGKRNNTVYLEHTHWDDWFSYATQYFATYIDFVGDKKEIGLVKIVEKDQSERVPKLPDQFEKLGAKIFFILSTLYLFWRLNHSGRFGITKAAIQNSGCRLTA